MSWRSRFLSLLLSIGYAVVVAILVMTPLSWRLLGSQPETYPELFYLAAGAPIAGAFVLSSAAIAFFSTRRAPEPLRVINFILGIAAVLTLAPLMLGILLRAL